MRDPLVASDRSVPQPDLAPLQVRTAERTGESALEREQQALAESPEVKAKLAEMLEKHYASWIRLPGP